MLGSLGKEHFAERVRNYDFYSAVHTLICMGFKLGGDLRMVPRRGTYFSGCDLDSFLPGVPFNDILYETDADVRHMEKFHTLVVNLLGLFGPDSILPFYFNHIITTDMETGPNLAGLLEIINDKIYQNLYRVWSIPRRMDRTTHDSRRDQSEILACCGLNLNQLALPTEAMKTAYLMHPTRSAWGLKQLTTDVLGVGTELDQRVPFRIKLDETAQSRLGSQYSRLGKDIYLGDEISNISMYYRIKFGPMDAETFFEFLPTGPKYKFMMGILDLYTPFHLKYDIELKVKKQESDKIKWNLGTKKSRLGFTSVAGRRKPDRDFIVKWRKRDDEVVRTKQHR